VMVTFAEGEDKRYFVPPVGKRAKKGSKRLGRYVKGYDMKMGTFGRAPAALMVTPVAGTDDFARGDGTAARGKYSAVITPATRQFDVNRSLKRKVTRITKQLEAKQESCRRLSEN